MCSMLASLANRWAIQLFESQVTTPYPSKLSLELSFSVFVMRKKNLIDLLLEIANMARIPRLASNVILLTNS